MAVALVVDDDQAAVRIVQKRPSPTWRSKCFRPTAVAEGELLFDRRPPTCSWWILCSPPEAGCELRGAFRAADATLPVIFLTASEDSDVAIEAMKLGAYDYLLKPLDAARLGEVIHRAVETRRMMQSPLQRPAEADEGAAAFCAEQAGWPFRQRLRASLLPPPPTC